MTPIWITGFATTFVGAGIGGLISILMNGYRRSTGTLYAACAGAILGIMGFEIVPEVLEYGGWATVAAGFLAGLFLFWMIHLVFHFPTRPSGRMTDKPVFLLTLAIIIHNFPIGIMMAAGDPVEMSASLMQTLVLHNVPEGMILFMPLVAAGLKFVAMFMITFLIAFPVGAGAIFGEMLGLQHERLSAFLISLSVGMIYRIATKEIYPEAVRLSSNAYSLFVAVVSFLLMGLFLLWV